MEPWRERADIFPLTKNKHSYWRLLNSATDVTLKQTQQLALASLPFLILTGNWEGPYNASAMGLGSFRSRWICDHAGNHWHQRLTKSSITQYAKNTIFCQSCRTLLYQINTSASLHCHLGARKNTHILTSWRRFLYTLLYFENNGIAILEPLINLLLQLTDLFMFLLYLFLKI